LFLTVITGIIGIAADFLDTGIVYVVTLLLCGPSVDVLLDDFIAAYAATRIATNTIMMTATTATAVHVMFAGEGAGGAVGGVEGADGVTDTQRDVVLSLEFMHCSPMQH
jgi:hypothetical protein